MVASTTVYTTKPTKRAMPATAVRAGNLADPAEPLAVHETHHHSRNLERRG
jgi:hypothetical protein